MTTRALEGQMQAPAPPPEIVATEAAGPLPEGETCAARPSDASAAARSAVSSGSAPNGAIGRGSSVTGPMLAAG